MLRFLIGVVALVLTLAAMAVFVFGAVKLHQKQHAEGIVAMGFTVVLAIGCIIAWLKATGGGRGSKRQSAVEQFAATYSKSKPIAIEDAPDGLKVLAVDIESTGIGRDDELIELTLRLLVFDRETGLVIADLGAYHSYREPTVPISAAASKMNGITMDMVRGQSLDVAAIHALAEHADVCMGHYTSFLRTFLDPHVELDLPWRCTCRDVKWPSAGASTKLADLAAIHGISIRAGTKSQADMATLLTLIQMPSPRTGKPYAMEVLKLDRPARKSRKRASAEKAPN